MAQAPAPASSRIQRRLWKAGRLVQPKARPVSSHDVPVARALERQD